MSRTYKISMTDLNSSVSFGGGGRGGNDDTDRANRQAEFARQNSAARNSRGRFDGIGANPTDRDRCILGATIGGAIANSKGGPASAGLGALGGFTGGVIGC